MNRDTLLAAVAAVTFVVGGMIAWSGWGPRATPIVTAHVPRVSTMVALITAAIVFAASGWGVPSLAIGGIAGWMSASLRRRDGGDGAGVERTEALASWVENVRDVLQSGNQPIGAIGATTATCPPAIRPQVLSLFARLSAGQQAELVFRRFADEMDDPLADLVAVGLLIAVSRGAETEDVLSALAVQARHQADRRRIVEAERAPMRREVLMVSVVMCALLGGVFAFSRSSYLDAYDDIAGQLFLTVILVGYGCLLLWVSRLARFPKPSRFLTLGLSEP